ncbi:MAG: hypothetical protein ACRER2_02250 [Methylococcales bacterium]
MTTKGRFAVTAMVDLAYHCNRKPVALADIGKRQSISLAYLDGLRLKGAKFLPSVVGFDRYDWMLGFGLILPGRLKVRMAGRMPALHGGAPRALHE